MPRRGVPSARFTAALGRAGSTAYYVNATGGNDTNDGKSPASAWQTIVKVNAAMVANCTILFKRGETWTGTVLSLTKSNVRIADYSTGALPIIDGNATVDCITNSGVVHDVTIENIECVNGFQFGISFNGACYNLKVINCVSHASGDEPLILANGVHHVTVTGGHYYSSTGAQDVSQACCIEVIDDCDTVLIDGAEMDHAPQSGISIHNHTTPTAMPTNVTIQNCNIHDNGGIGVRVANIVDSAQADMHLVIQDNLITANTLDGIATVMVGTLTNYVNGVTICRNRILLNKRWGISLRSDNTICYQNLFTCDNEDAKDCLSIDSCIGLSFWNNTLYGSYAAYDGLIVANGARCSGIDIRNNILAASGNNPYMIKTSAAFGVTGLVIDYNLYSYTSTGNRWTWAGTNVSYTTWLTNGVDAHSPARGNPLFVNPGTDFTLQAGSPAIDTGTDVGLPYLGAAPDCGYAEKA